MGSIVEKRLNTRSAEIGVSARASRRSHFRRALTRWPGTPARRSYYYTTQTLPPQIMAKRIARTRATAASPLLAGGAATSSSKGQPRLAPTAKGVPGRVILPHAAPRRRSRHDGALWPTRRAPAAARATTVVHSLSLSRSRVFGASTCRRRAGSGHPLGTAGPSRARGVGEESAGTRSRRLLLPKYGVRAL